MIKSNNFYTAMNEAVFYYCIGNNLDIVKILIQQVLKIKIHSIESKNVKLLKDYMNTKEKTLDYLVLTDRGYINIEINNSNEEWRTSRNVSYACKVLSNSLRTEQHYKEIAPVIQINLNRLGKTKSPYAVYKLRTDEKDKKYPTVLTNIIEIYVLNVDFYKNMVYNGNKKFIYDNYLLCALDLLPETLDNISEGNEKLMEFKKSLEEINNNEDFVNWISAEEEDKKIRRTKELIAEEKAQQRLAQGIKQGIKQGIEQGIEQGKKENTIEIAQNMLRKNMDIKTISELTGLCMDEISELKK